MAEVRIKDIDENEIDTILAEDIDFEGHLTFKKPLMIKGRFKGVIASASALHIGEKAHVEASTKVGIVSSRGTHKGDIVASARVELYSTAKVDGDITTPDFVMESGCRFNGACSMGGGARETAAAPAHATPAHATPTASAPAAATPVRPAPASSTPSAGAPAGAAAHSTGPAAPAASPPPTGQHGGSPGGAQK
jgi:cytoskeletal protein CcmA (bactofilin family)